MLGFVKFSLILLPQEASDFLGIDLAISIFVNVIENPLAEGFQSVSISAQTDLNKVGWNLLTCLSLHHFAIFQIIRGELF